jgi:hypothetical protein
VLESGDTLTSVFSSKLSHQEEIFMQPKLVDILIKIFAYAFTPYSKWHIVVQFYHLTTRFIFHEVGQNAGTIGEALFEAVQTELMVASTPAFIGVVLMHICYGEQMRKTMRKSRILPMVDEPKWLKWIRRIILLTRH